MKWFSVLLMVLICVGVCSAAQFVESDFWRNPTGKDISWLEISKRMGVTENQAKAWGPVNRPNGLKSGEWTAKRDLGIGPWFAWYYHSSDQVEGGLNQQMKGLPKDKLSIVKDLVNGPKPKHGKLIWGQVLSWMKFQQKDKKKADYVENVVCLWQDMAKAGRKISELPTFVWTESGIGYAADCYNLYGLPQQPKVEEPPPKTESVPPTEEPPVVSPPAPSAPEEETPHPLWGKGVVWAIGEYVNADSTTQANSYDGVEWRFHFNSALAWTIRGEVGLGWNFPDEDVPETSSRTLMLRTGLRYKLIYQAPFELDIEAGPAVWLHNEDFAVFKGNGGPDYEEGSAGEASGGGYVRLLAKGRYETYFEVEYRELGKERGYGAAFSAEPKRLYFDVGLSGNESDELRKDEAVYRSDSTFTEWHAKAGYKFLVKEYPLIIAATYQSWSYESNSWMIDWKGPGLYLESRPDPKGRWRFKAHVWSFERTDGPPNEEKKKSNEFRAQVGLTYSW